MKKLFVILLLCSLHSPAGASADVNINLSEEKTTADGFSPSPAEVDFANNSPTEETTTTDGSSPSPADVDIVNSSPTETPPTTDLDQPHVTTPAPAQYCFSGLAGSPNSVNLWDADQGHECSLIYTFDRSTGCKLSAYGIDYITEQDKDLTARCVANPDGRAVTCTCYETNCNRDLAPFHTVLAGIPGWNPHNVPETMLECLASTSLADAAMPPLTIEPATTTDSTPSPADLNFANSSPTENPSITDLDLLRVTQAPGERCFFGDAGRAISVPLPYAAQQYQCSITYQFDNSTGCKLHVHRFDYITEQDKDLTAPRCVSNPDGDLVTCFCYEPNCNGNLAHFHAVLVEPWFEAPSNMSSHMLHCLVSTALADAGMPPITIEPDTSTDYPVGVTSCIKGDSTSATSVAIAEKDQGKTACTIKYQWNETDCLLTNYGVNEIISHNDSLTPVCYIHPWPRFAVCQCYESDCNSDLRFFRDTLETVLLRNAGSKSAEDFASCLVDKSKRTAPSLYCLTGKPDSVSEDTSGSKGLARCTITFEKNTNSCTLVEYGMVPIWKGKDEDAGQCSARDSSSFVCHCRTDYCNAEFEQFHAPLSSTQSPTPDSARLTCDLKPKCAVGPWDYEERKAEEYCFISYSRSSGQVELGSKTPSKEINTSSRMCQLIASDVICFCKADKCNNKDIFRGAPLYDKDWKEMTGPQVPYPNLRMKHCGEHVALDPWNRKVCRKLFTKNEDQCDTWISFRDRVDGKAEGCAVMEDKDIVECVCETDDCSDIVLKPELEKEGKRIDPANPQCVRDLLSCPYGYHSVAINKNTAFSRCTVKVKVDNTDGSCTIGEYSSKDADEDSECLLRESGDATCYCSSSDCIREIVEILRKTPAGACKQRITQIPLIPTLPPTTTPMSTVEPTLFTTPAGDESTTDEAETDEPMSDGNDETTAASGSTTEENGMPQVLDATTVSQESEASSSTEDKGETTTTTEPITTKETEVPTTTPLSPETGHASTGAKDEPTTTTAPPPMEKTTSEVPATASEGTTEKISVETAVTEGGTDDGNKEDRQETEEEKAGFPVWIIWVIVIVVAAAIIGYLSFVAVKTIMDKKEREEQAMKAEAEALIPQIVVQKPVVPEQKPANPEQKPAILEQKKSNDVAAENQEPTKAATPAKKLTLRQMLEKEALEREMKKNRRQKLLKANRAHKPDVFSDRRFQKAGPLKFTHFSKYLPENNLTSSGSIKGDGPIEFNHAENKIYLMGSDIEEMEPSPEGTQDSEDETQDSEDSTQDSNKVPGQKKAARKGRKRGQGESKEKKEKKEKKHKRQKKAGGGKSRSKGGTRRHGHKGRTGQKHRKGHRRSREGVSRGSGTKTSGQLAGEGSRLSARNQAARMAEAAIKKEKAQEVAAGSRPMDVEKGI